MSAVVEPVQQAIKLSLDSSGIPKNSLASLITQLEQIESKWKSLDALIGNTNATLAQTPRKAQEIQAALLKAQSSIVAQSGGAKGFKASAVAQAMGADAAAFEGYLARIKKGVQGYHRTIQEFRNLPAASRAFASFESDQYRRAQQRVLNLGSLLKPGVSSVHGNGQLKVEGVIPLAIPAAQVQASVVGPIQVVIPGSQMTVSGSGPGPALAQDAGNRNEKGKFVATATGGKHGKKKGGTAYFTAEEMSDLPRGATVTRRDLIGGADMVTVTELKAAGQTLATTFEKIEDSVKETRQVIRTPGDLTPLQQFRLSRRILGNQFRSQVLGLSATDNGMGLASIYEKHANQLQSLLTPELEGQLAPAQAAAIKAELSSAASKLMAQAVRAKAQAADQIGLQLRQEAMSDLARQGGSGGSATMIQGQAALALEDYKQNLKLEKEAAKRRQGARSLRSRQYRGYSLANVSHRLPPAQFPGSPAWMTPTFFNPPEEPRPEERKPSRLEKAFQQGFTPSGFATHMVKVTGWAAAVTTLYKSWELVDYSMHRVLDVGMQMSHLSVIYKQQGGSVKELTDDILAQAAAQGRSTDEAMESATEWSRLQLTRAQTNEAVRVSMMAANVAEMSTLETTKQLMSLMHIYHLQVSDLNGELGKLVYTSQHYNVTLEDLFQGLDRAAPQARQMGMSLAELTGVIAGTVGKTGQSGTVVGNTVKYILQEFNRPEIQTMMRGFGIETTAAGGELKQAPEILRELFVRYQGLNNTERQSLTTQLAGRFHGARFVGMMDSYLESQKMAIDSQLNLNAAQSANATILDTLQNKLEGLKSEWDRFVYSQATRPSSALGGFTPMDLMTGTIGGATGVMQGFDSSHTSALTTPLVAGGYGAAALFRRFLWGRFAKTRAGDFVGKVAAERILPEVLASRLGGSTLSYLLGPEVGIPLTLASLLPSVGGLARSLGTSATPMAAGDEWIRAAEIMGARGGAASSRANLFQTTMDLLGIKNPDKIATANIAEAVELSGTEMGSPEAAALKKAFAAGDYDSASAILQKAMNANNAKSVVDLQAQTVANQKAVAAKQQRIDDLNRGLQGTPGINIGGGHLIGVRNPLSGQAASDARKEIQDLTGDLQQLNEAATESQQALEDVEGTPPEALSRKQEYISLLQQETELLTAIGELAQQGGAGTPLDKLASEQQAAQMQVDVAQSYYNRLQEYIKENPAHAVEAAPARDEALQQLQQAQAQLDTLNSPERQGLAQLEQDRGIVYQRTDLETQGVGYTETEKLLNRQNMLQSDLKQYGNMDPNKMSDNDRTRALAESIEMEKTRQALIERSVELRRQEQQIIIDSTREYEKAMMFASPGELLQRLFVSQVAGRGAPSTGEFMSWSPEMRRYYYDMRGGDAGARNREEQALLNGAGYGNVTVEGQQGAAASDQGTINYWRSTLKQGVAAATNGAPSMQLPGEAKTAATAMSALGTAAAATATVLKVVNAALADFVKNLKPPGAPAPATPKNSFGIVPGFSLGMMGI